MKNNSMIDLLINLVNLHEGREATVMNQVTFNH